MSALDRHEDNPLQEQHGGSHYVKLKFQPVEYIHANDLDFFQGNVVKYITRHKHKGKAEDIRKAIHYCRMILELQYGEQEKMSSVSENKKQE